MRPSLSRRTGTKSILFVYRTIVRIYKFLFFRFSNVKEYEIILWEEMKDGSTRAKRKPSHRITGDGECRRVGSGFHQAPVEQFRHGQRPIGQALLEGVSRKARECGRVLAYPVRPEVGSRERNGSRDVIVEPG